MAKDIIKMLKKEVIPIITKEMNKTEDDSFPEQQRGAALNAMLLYSYFRTRRKENLERVKDKWKLSL